MTEVEARQSLELKLAQRGIVGAAVDPEIEHIAKSIPDLVRTNFDENPVIAADQYFDKYVAIMEGEKTVAPTVQAAVAPAATVAIPAADQKAIQAFQSNTKAARTERATKTKIVRLIGDKPYPGKYLSKDLKMVPHANEAKFATYEENLVDTPENKENYKKCMDAIKNKTPMEIYIPEETKWSPRTIGAEVSTPAANGSGVETKTFDMSGLLAFVAYDLTGFITCDANGIGAKLGAVRIKKSSKAASTQGALQPTLKIVNRKSAFQAADKHTYASAEKKNGNTVLTKTGTVRSALSFQIYTGKTDNMGNKKTRTVRVSGRAEVPKFERVSAAYEDLFGSVEKQSDVVTAPTGKDRAAMDAILSKTLFAIQQNSAEFGDVSLEIEQKIQEAGAGTSANQDFE